MTAAAKVEELWVHPVKGCQGVSIKTAKITPAGIEFDRTWCIVDLDGTHAPKLEALAGGRLPILASIEVKFQDEKKKDIICLNAPGMDELCIPTDAAAYEDGPTVRVESAGEGWSLAFLDCKMHEKGSKWITRYLNRPKDGQEGKAKPRYVNGKTIKGNFALVRSMDDLVDLGEYPPIFPLIERSKYDPQYAARFKGNYRRLADFAPFLLVSKASARDLALKAQVDNYPIRSFRGNIVVDGDQLEPWVEENWSRLEIMNGSSSSSLVLHSIKPCPRCTVPCRDQTTGNFLFSEKLLLWRVLKAAFPQKFHDPEWGGWASVYFGLYMGANGKVGEIHVGDEVKVLESVPWDAHLFGRDGVNKLMNWPIACGIAVLVASVGILVSFANTKPDF